MEYRTWVRYENGTTIFYFAFKERNGFINYLSTQKDLKEKLNALSVATSTAKNILRIVMPFGTNEKDFKNKVHITLMVKSMYFGKMQHDYEYNKSIEDFFNGFKK